MTKFNKPQRTPAAPGIIRTAETVPSLKTGEGAPGFMRDTLSELFLLACSNMVGEDTFYEKSSNRDARYATLIERAVIEGHADWLTRFFPWLRRNANMRSASLLGAAIATKTMVSLGIPGGRQMIDSVLVRADEPGEMLAAWTSMFSTKIPRPVRRGVADAAGRLYTQRNVIKYDTDSKGWSFGGVIEYTGAVPQMVGGVDLFKYLVTKSKHRSDLAIPESLTMLHANQQLRIQAAEHPTLLLNTARLRQAGMTWEAAKSLAGSRVQAKDLWRVLIPEMGYMALLRNLRNFDQVGVDGDVCDLVRNKLMDPAEVAASRQLPMRFLSAHNSMVSNRWSHALDVALELSLGSIPQLGGSTLILIDTSGSMASVFSKNTDLKLWDAATIFGLALAKRCDNAQVVSFSNVTKVFPQVKGESLLKGLDRFRKGYFQGAGTNTRGAVAQHCRGYDRIIILTDEQCGYGDGWDLYDGVSRNTQIVTFNLAGYQAAQAASDANRVTVGGLSDAAFTLLGSLDRFRQQAWPF